MSHTIIINKIRCKECGDVIESLSVWDFKFCKCKKVAVDGGREYLRRIGETDDYEDLSVIKKGKNRGFISNQKRKK